VAEIVEDVHRQYPVLAVERLDHHLAERRAIGEVEERAAAVRGAVVGADGAPSLNHAGHCLGR